MIETLRADGFDALVLNFTMRRWRSNRMDSGRGHVSEVQSLIPPREPSPSWGTYGRPVLPLRAQKYMESHARPRIACAPGFAFDGPHAGADIPLGLQYGSTSSRVSRPPPQSFLAILNRPAAREQLVYHYTTQATPTGVHDPMRARC